MRLLERAEHLAVLEGTAAAARSSGQLVLVSGEAGVGKTALVRAFGAAAPAGSRVLVGRCDDLFAPRPLGPLSDIARDIGGPLRQALEADDQHAVFEAFLGALNPPEPTIVVLEDLQWADDATLDLVRFIARRLDRTRCLLIATHRDDIPMDHPLRRAIGALTGEGVHRLRLEPLSMDAVRSLASGTSIDAVALHDVTGGNPFFVVEVLAGGSWTIPATVRDAVLARAAALPRPARDALDVAAVLGASATSELVMTLSGCHGVDLEACLAAGLLDADGRHLRFRHDLTQLAVGDALTPWRRRALHAQALDALREGGEVTELANHAIAADDAQEVLRLAPVAAARCAAMGANRAAAALCASAVAHCADLPPARQLELYEAHARASKEIGADDEAARAGQRVLELLRAERAGPLREGSWLAWLSGVHGCGADVREADEGMAQALALLEPLGETRELAEALATVAGRGMLVSDVAMAMENGERALPMALRLGDEDLAIRVLSYMGTMLATADEARGFELLFEALERAEAAGNHHGVVRACNNIGSAFNAQWRPSEALPFLARGVQAASDHETPISPAFVMGEVGLALVLLGRWQEAEDVLLRSTAGLDPGVDQMFTQMVHSALRVRRGTHEGDHLLDDVLALAEPTEQLQALHPIFVTRAEHAWLRGDLESARRHVEAAVPRHDGHHEPWRLGELALWCGRTGVDLPYDAPVAEPFEVQLVGRHREAADLWQARGCRYAAADALGDSDDEHDLRDALEVLHELGAAPRAAMVAKRLRELGARTVPRGPRATTRAHPAGLTTREVEVARLIGEGLSNAEIAGRLVVSAKTVDHHVSAVLAKLAVASRRDVAVALADLEMLQDGEPVRPR